MGFLETNQGQTKKPVIVEARMVRAPPVRDVLGTSLMAASATSNAPKFSRAL